MSEKKIFRKKLFDRLKILGECDNNDIFLGWHIINFIKVPPAEEMISNYDKKIIEQWNTHNFNDDEKYKYNICLCSKYPLQELNLIRHDITKQQCIIGSCCILNFGHKNIKTELKIKKGNIQGKKYCSLCKRKLLDDTPNWKLYHKKCYFESLNDSESNDEDTRYCLKCKKKLPSSMEPWKNYHPKCYYLVKN